MIFAPQYDSSSRSAPECHSRTQKVFRSLSISFFVRGSCSLQHPSRSPTWMPKMAKRRGGSSSTSSGRRARSSAKNRHVSKGCWTIWFQHPSLGCDLQLHRTKPLEHPPSRTSAYIGFFNFITRPWPGGSPSSPSASRGSRIQSSLSELGSYFLPCKNAVEMSEVNG